MWHVKLYITRNTRRPAAISKICSWIHTLARIYRTCIVIHKSLVWDDSLHYFIYVPYAEILQICLFFSMIWYSRIQSPAVSKQQDVRWCGFVDRLPNQLAMLGIQLLIGISRLLYAHIAYEIDTAKIIAAFCRISYSLHDLIRMNSIDSHVSKQQHVRWCGCRWSIPIWIDYVWSVPIDRAISTP